MHLYLNLIIEEMMKVSKFKETVDVILVFINFLFSYLFLLHKQINWRMVEYYQFKETKHRYISFLLKQMFGERSSS